MQQITRPAYLQVHNQRPHSAHYLVDRLLRSLDALTKRHPGAKPTLHWIPGHCNLDGNERADVDTKCAVHEDSSPIDPLPPWLTCNPLPARVSKVQQAPCAHSVVTLMRRWPTSSLTASPTAPPVPTWHSNTAQRHILYMLSSRNQLQSVTPSGTPTSHATLWHPTVISASWTSHNNSWNDLPLLLPTHASCTTLTL